MEYFGLQRGDLELFGLSKGPFGAQMISGFMVVIWGSWEATLGPRDFPRGLFYPTRPQEEEMNIKQETYDGDIPLIRAKMRAFSCVIFILTPFLNGLS